MTEDEHIYLVKLCDQFYTGFAKLIGRTVSKAPKHLHDELIAMLSDQSSVHGSPYEQYITKEIKSCVAE